MSELWHCLILLGVLEVFWFYATLIIFVDNNNIQTIEIFGNVTTPFGTLDTSDLSIKIYGDRPRGTPPSGG